MALFGIRCSPHQILKTKGYFQATAADLTLDKSRKPEAGSKDSRETTGPEGSHPTIELLNHLTSPTQDAHSPAPFSHSPSPRLLTVSQWQPYEHPATLPPSEALQAILESMDACGVKALQGQTQLIIAPGYQFRLISGMVTNFHQPRSTLLLLIAALIGEDWRRAYQYALDNDFRFLSYGDSCLLLPG